MSDVTAAELSVRSVDRLARSIACAREAEVPLSAARLPESTFMSGIAAAVARATTPAPTRAVVATAAYLLRGGVGTRRRPLYRSRSFRELTHTLRSRWSRAPDGWGTAVGVGPALSSRCRADDNHDTVANPLWRRQAAPRAKSQVSAIVRRTDDATSTCRTSGSYVLASSNASPEGRGSGSTGYRSFRSWRTFLSKESHR